MNASDDDNTTTAERPRDPALARATRTIALGAAPAPATGASSGRSVEEVRASLGEKLDELHRRATRTRRLLSPSTYLDNPWVRAGIAVAAGLVLVDGFRRFRPRRTTATSVVASAPEGLVHAVVRSGLMAAAHVIVTRALTERGEP